MSSTTIDTVVEHAPTGAAPTRPAFTINNFDLIRLFAALQVAIFHGFERFGLPIPDVFVPLGWFQGVPIFFVISGFLISASWERQKDLLRYARNRALRIFPGLWACLFLTVVVAALTGSSFASPAAFLWLPLQMVGVIYTPGFLDQFGDGTYNGSLWTIPLELQFYVVLPIVYWLTARLSNRTSGIIVCFLVALAIAIGVKLAFPSIAGPGETTGVKLLRYSFLPRVYLFLLGVVLQRLQLYLSPTIRGKAGYWLAGYAALNLFVPQVGLMYMVDEVVLAVTIISAAYTVPTAGARILRGNDVSYGTYLYHGLVINLFLELALPRTGWTMLAMLLCAIALGAVSWLIVERPAMALKKLRLRRLSAASSTR